MRTKALLLGFIFVLFGNAVPAQESRATILGTVFDQSAARVPGAEIRITNVETNIVTASLSNDSGYYEAPFLIPGRYKIEAELPGFKKFVRGGITLAVNQRAAIDIILEVGETTEVVTVTGDTSLLETSNASAGQVIDNKRINELPLTDSNPFVLASLAPGVVWNGTPEFRRAFDNNGTSAISVAGAGNRNNEWTIDGIPNTQGNRVAYVPPADAVQEFKIEATSFDASYGHTAGGTVNVSIKSGTNELHGSVYELHRQNRWNATDWFVNRSFWADVAAGRRRAEDNPQRSGRYNQLGFTVGGPVWFPKLYNGKDRTFFFFSYNGIYQIQAEPSFYRMPTEAERNGDFSELLARGGSAFQIYDPFSGKLQSGRVVRQPFKNNVLPANLISPVAKKYLQFFPLPNNTTGVGADFSNNYFAANQPRGDDFYSFANRFDHQISDDHKMFVRWHYNNRLEDRGDWTGKGLMSNGLVRINSGLAVDDVYTITPRTILNFTLGWSLFKDGNKRRTDGFDIAELGFPAYLKERAGDLQHLPRVEISGMPGIGNGRSAFTWQHIYMAKSSLTRVQSNHTLKTGFDIRLYRRNNFSPGNVGGTFSFNNNFTRKDSVTSAQQSGLAFAAFLLGVPSGGSVSTNDSFALQNLFWSIHFHDDWRLTRRLTLNLGFRYEYEGPSSERFDRFSLGYDFNTPSPIAAAAEAAYAKNPLAELPASAFKLTGGPIYPGVGDNPTVMWRGDKDNVMPRLGAAFKVTEKLVLRGGYGIYYNSSIGVQDTAGVQTGFSQPTSLVASNDSGLTFIGLLTPSKLDPFPPILAGGARFLAPAGSSKGLAQNIGLSYRFLNNERLNPYQHRWRFGIQYQIARDMVAEVAYTGSTSRDVHLDETRLNILPKEFWATGNVRNNAIETDLRRNVPNPFRGLIPDAPGYSGSTIQKHNLLRAFPHMNGLLRNDDPIGKSFFHSAEARFEKRFSAGWTLLASFTKVKQIDETVRLNEFDTVLDRVLSGDTRDHRFVVSGIFEIPYGRGRRFGRDIPGFVNHVVGGWQVGFIYQAQTGEPISFGNLFYNGSTADIFIPESERTVDGWFNTSGFVRASADQPGSFHVRVFPVRPNERLRRDGLNMWDMNLLKNFYLDETRLLQLKFDFLNAWNHPHFDNPNRTPTSSNFGKVTSMWGLPRAIQFNLHLLF